jgi:3-hydroxyisobutyrate dehydrogenase
MKNIGFIGLGVMGKHMANNLAKNGYKVYGYNRSKEKTIALANILTPCFNIKDICDNCEIIITIVGYPSDVEEVYTELFKYSRNGSILLDMTTSSPSLAKRLYLEGKKKGISVLDSPVTGGEDGAIYGKLSIMVGGDEDVFNKSYDILKCLGTTINYMGEAGNGQYTKLANQTAIAGTIAGVAEALSFAEKKNIDKNKLLSVITAGSGDSHQARTNGYKMVNKDYKPTFYIKHYLKDLNLVLEEAGTFELDVVKKVRDIYDKLVVLGNGDVGIQYIIEYYLKKLS